MTIIASRLIHHICQQIEMLLDKSQNIGFARVVLTDYQVYFAQRI